MGRKFNFVQFLIILVIFKYFLTAKKQNFNLKKNEIKMLQGLENISFKEFCQSDDCAFSNEVEYEEFKHMLYENKIFLQKKNKIKKSSNRSQKNDSCLFDNEGESFNQTDYTSSDPKENNEESNLNTESKSNERKIDGNFKEFKHNKNRKFRHNKIGSNISKLLQKHKTKEQEKKKLIKNFRKYETNGINKKIHKKLLNDTVECDTIPEEKKTTNFSEMENNTTKSEKIDNEKNMTDNCPEEDIYNEEHKKKNTSKVKTKNSRIKNENLAEENISKQSNITECDDENENNENITRKKKLNNFKSSNISTVDLKTNQSDNEEEDCEENPSNNSSLKNKKNKINYENKNSNETEFSDCESEDDNNTNYKLRNINRINSTNISQLFYNNTLNSTDCSTGKEKLHIPFYNNTFECNHDHKLIKDQKNISHLYYNNTCGCNKKDIQEKISSEKLKQIFYNNTENECKKARMEEIKRKNKANLGNFLYQLSKIEKKNNLKSKPENSNKSIFLSPHHKKLLNRNLTLDCESIINSNTDSLPQTTSKFLIKNKKSNLIFNFPKIQIFPSENKLKSDDCHGEEKNIMKNIQNKNSPEWTSIQINNKIKSLISSRNKKLSNEFEQFMKSKDDSKKIELNILKSFFESFIKGYQSVPKERSIKKWGKIIKIVENFEASFKCKKNTMADYLSFNFLPGLEFALKNLTYENLASGIQRTNDQLNKIIFLIGSRCEGIDVILNMITKDFRTMKISNKSKKIIFSKAKNSVLKSLKNYSFLQAGYNIGIIYGIANSFSK